MDLIPGLPNEIARQCLFRVHHMELSATLSSVCKAWKSELQSPQFWRCRKQTGNGNKELILLRCESGNIYKLILLEPETRIWSELPPIPDFPSGVPSGYMEGFEFRVASFRWGFVVVGFKQNMEVPQGCTKVYVFDYFSGTWRRGANMPDEQLYVYRCTSDRDRKVYVLFRKGWCTECIMVYDVMKDEWSSRIDVRRQGGACSVGSMRGMIYQNGKIHFFDKWIQGGHDNDKRVVDVSTWEWDEPNYDFLDCEGFDMCLSDDGEWYSCRVFGALVTYKDKTWQQISHVPNEEGEIFDYMITWKSKLMVIWGRWDSDAHEFETRVLDLKNHKWTTFDRPKQFTGRIQTGCYLEI